MLGRWMIVSLRGLSCALAVASVAGGCNLWGGGSAEVKTIRSAQTDAPVAQRTTMKNLMETLAQRARARREAGLNVLLISGGGQHGAYAAGFLRGWVAAGQSMPKFDLVTGVGTGALQAPFALLGTAEAIERGAKLFRTAAVEPAADSSHWYEMRRATGIPDATEYQRAVELAVDETFQAELRTLHDKKRQVAIATTDFDLGTLRVWDFAHEIGTDRRGRRRAQALLVASATVPGVFPPTMVDNHVHAAGEVFGGMLVPFSFDDYLFFAKRLRAIGVAETVYVRTYVIVNGFLTARRDPVDPEDRGAMGRRANELMRLASQAQTLDRLSDLTDAVNGGIAGLRMELRVTAIPESMAAVEGSGERYDEHYALELEQTGFDRGGRSDAWDKVVQLRERSFD
jgi:hypothetical protein